MLSRKYQFFVAWLVWRKSEAGFYLLLRGEGATRVVATTACKRETSDPCIQASPEP
ncbi:unnamed protein product, partial [Musa textilis]